jgi:hypothetical protein
MTTSDTTIQPISQPEEAVEAWDRIYSDEDPAEVLEPLAIRLALGMVEYDSVRDAMEEGPLRNLRPVRGFVHKLARLSNRLVDARLVDIIKSDHEAAEFILRHPSAVIALKRQERESEVRKLPFAPAAAPARPQAEPKVSSAAQAKRDVTMRLAPAPWVSRAALVLVGLGLGLIAGRRLESRDRAGPMTELLTATLTPAPRQDRSGNADEIRVTADGSFAIRPGAGYSLIIRSPRAGAATIVLSGAGQTIVYPKEGRDPILVDAEMKSHSYGPLPAPLLKSTAIVVITDSDATATIRAIVEGKRTTPGESLEALIRDEFSKAGRPWVAIERVIVEPSSQPETKP